MDRLKHPYAAEFKVAVDFDGTIAPSVYPGLPDKPFPYARERLQSYRDAGFAIIIYTVRTHPAQIDAYEQAGRLRIWLRYHKIPFDLISVDGKPPADVYIDDKAHVFVSWFDSRLAPERLKQMYGRESQGTEEGKARRVWDRKPDGQVWIGLAGKMGSGKSSVSTVLQGLYGNAHVRGFAAGVKEKARSQGLDPSVKTPTMREVLQEIGHGERERNPSYWIERYWEWAKQLPDFPFVNLIVDDVRYPNEVEFLWSKGFRVGYIYVPKPIRTVRLLRRDGAVPYGRFDHESEIALDDFEGWDFTINNFTADDMRKAIHDPVRVDPHNLQPIDNVRPVPGHSCGRGMDCPLYERLFKSPFPADETEQDS